jgi:hypothetical protein
MAFISNGTTILDNGAFQASLGNLVFISEQTASASASIEFTTGIDSTYPIYRFEFISIHPASDNVSFDFNLSVDSGSNYNVTKTTTLFRTSHDEADSFTQFGYNANEDLAQSTAFQHIVYGLGNGNDECVSGQLTIFSPSSDTFVKHFMSTASSYFASNGVNEMFVAGYGNTTSAVDGIKFQMSSGNIDSGTIKLYGIKDS